MSDDVEAIKESAKAVQEVAKFGSKVVDAANNAAPFVNRVLGKPLEDATGLFLGDPLRAARILAQDWIARRVNEKLRERNIRDEELKAVPPNIAIPLLEAAQDETRDALEHVERVEQACEAEQMQRDGRHACVGRVNADDLLAHQPHRQ